MKNIFLLFILMIAFDAAAQNRHKDLFLKPDVQDSLKTFIERNNYALSNPYDAPTIYLVTVEQNAPSDTTITFMSSYSLIEEISLDGKTEPSLYIKGGCMQYDKTVVLFIVILQLYLSLSMKVFLFWREKIMTSQCLTIR